jgi:hypothetical protein
MSSGMLSTAEARPRFPRRSEKRRWSSVFRRMRPTLFELDGAVDFDGKADSIDIHGRLGR